MENRQQAKGRRQGIENYELRSDKQSFSPCSQCLCGENIFMDNQEIRTLQLLEEFEKEENPSQRALARKLNVSLGLVNSFIKRLARKGYFKITTLPANRVGYILTPKGAAEKTRLTYEYIQYSFLYYRQTRARLRSFFAGLEQQGIVRLVFWGAGELAEIAYVSLQETSIELVAVIDEEMNGKKFFGMEIHGREVLEGYDFDMVLVTQSGNVEGIVTELSNLEELAGRVVAIQ
jgi:DNA-binding MarR family transcriptional regulator